MDTFGLIVIVLLASILQAGTGFGLLLFIFLDVRPHGNYLSI